MPRSSIAQPFRGIERGRDDRHVAGAAADVAAEEFAQRRFARVGRLSADTSRATSGCRACRSRIAARDGGGTPPAAPRGGRAPAQDLRRCGCDAPSACTASVRQARAGAPSIWTVQAPHTPCSQPTCVPVRPSLWRRKSVSSMRGSASPSSGAAVDVEADGVARVGAQARHRRASSMVARPSLRTRSRR